MRPQESNSADSLANWWLDGAFLPGDPKTSDRVAASRSRPRCRSCRRCRRRWLGPSTRRSTRQRRRPSPRPRGRPARGRGCGGGGGGVGEGQGGAQHAFLGTQKPKGDMEVEKDWLVVAKAGFLQGKYFPFGGLKLHLLDTLKVIILWIGDCWNIQLRHKLLSVCQGRLDCTGAWS